MFATSEGTLNLENYPYAQETLDSKPDSLFIIMNSILEFSSWAFPFLPGHR